MNKITVIIFDAKCNTSIKNIYKAYEQILYIKDFNLLLCNNFKLFNTNNKNKTRKENRKVPIG